MKKSINGVDRASDFTIEMSCRVTFPTSFSTERIQQISDLAIGVPVVVQDGATDMPEIERHKGRVDIFKLTVPVAKLDKYKVWFPKTLKVQLDNCVGSDQGIQVRLLL